MQYDDAERIAVELLIHHHLQHWNFGWNRRKRSLGLCRYHERRIELSAHFVQSNDETLIRETILHEIAHAIAGQRAGHGPRWKAVCRQIGCKPERCDKGEAAMPAGRWIAHCPCCAKEYSRHRRPHKAARYWCKACGPQKGPVQFYIAMPTPAAA